MLQDEIQGLLETVDDLQYANTKVCKRFKSKLCRFEKELLDLLQFVSDFQRHGSRINKQKRSFTGYNGMKLNAGD